MKTNKDITDAANDHLANLKALVSEAETMITDGASEQTSEMMENLRARFDAAQERFSEVYDGAKQKAVAGAKYTDTTIRENPYQAMAIAAGVGLLVGVLLGRRNK